MHQRRSIRLQGYDYASPGGYYITLLAHQRICLFGDIRDGQSILNPFGEIVLEEWLRTPEIRPEIILDEYVIMPNHLHAILFITDHTPPVRAHGSAPHGSAPPVRVDGSPPHGSPPQPPPQRPPKSLASLIAGYKSIVTKRINLLRNTPGAPVWQRNYYEHIIRDEQDLNRIRAYIRNNPLRW